MAVLYAVVAWFIMQAAEVFSELVGLPEQFGQVLLIALAVGFPIALIVSWFYELTPAGLALDKDAPASESVTPFAGRRLDFVIIAVLAAAILLFAYDKWWTGSPSKRSVAVLPFVAVSSGEDDGYFADGLTEEILTSLAQLPELQVTARTSSFFFKGKDVPVDEIARLLNVAYVLEGSVRRDGERLRITTQLVRAADGFHLWSQTYDRANEDVISVQQDIAEKVAGVLNVALDDETQERMSTIRINDVVASIAYQKGLEYFVRSHSGDLPLIEGLTTANSYFDEAIEAQPNLFAAHVLKADREGHVLLEMIGREEPDIGKVREQAGVWQAQLDLAWRASPSGNQHDILGLESKLASDNWTDLSALIQRALMPGDCPRLNLAERLQNLGLALELAKKLEEMLACDPLDADIIYRLAHTYSVAGRPDEALQVLDRAEAAGVSSARLRVARLYAQVVAGRFDALELEDYRLSEILQHLIQGNQAEARRVAEKWWAKPDISAIYALRIAAMVSDRARANEFAARIDKYPGSAIALVRSFGDCMIFRRLTTADGCRDGVPFDLEVTPNLKARIEESGLPWPPVAFRDASTEAL